MTNGKELTAEQIVKPAPFWTQLIRSIAPGAILPIGPFRPHRYVLPESYKLAQQKILSTIPYTGMDTKQWQKEYDIWAGFLTESQQRMGEYQAVSISEEIPSWYRGLASWTMTLGAEPALPSAEWEQLSAAQKQDEIVRKQFMQEEGQYFDYATSNMARAEWFANLLSALPILVATGKVSSLQDYDEVMGISQAEYAGSAGGYLSKEDVALANKVISDMVVKGGEVLETEDIPDFLQLSPEDEALVTDWIESPRPSPQPIGIAVITTEEILKAITAGPPVAKLPEGMTDEEFLHVMSLMDIPEEALAGATTIEDMIKPYADTISERDAMIRDVLAGVRSWEEPERTIGEKALFAVLQPMQFVADTMRPWIENVSYYTAGWATIRFQNLVFWNEGGLEKLYKQHLESGVSPYTATKLAWKDWDAPWGLKLAIEIPTDPITFIPGLGLKVPAMALRKIGLKAAGDALWNFNKALWRSSDLPFDIGKGFLAKIRTKGWMAPKQIADSRLEHFVMHLQTATEAYVQKPFNLVTWDDTAKTLRHAVKHVKKFPQQDNIYTRLGRELTSFPPMEPGDIAIWAKSVGGRLTREEIDSIPSIVDNVNNVLLDEAGRVGTTAQNAKRLAIIFMVDDDPMTMKRLISNLGRYTRKYSNRVENIIAVGERATTFRMAKMVEALVTSQKKIIDAGARSSYFRHREFGGMVVALQNTVDKMDRAIWRRALDKNLVRPMAEAYLGNPAYPVWNALESVGVSLLEGIVPRQAKLESLLMMTQGLEGLDPRWVARSASDIAGFFGSAPARTGGVHFMPSKDWMQTIVGKLPKKVQNVTPRWVTQAEWSEWMGRKYIELSDVWGNALRRNFIIRKMSQYLAEHAYNVAGRDLNKAIATLVDTGLPNIRRKSLRLSKDGLRQDMAGRVMTNNKDNVYAMKEMLTQSSLSQGEQMRILRQAGELSPQSRTLGEQMIMQGKVLTDYDSINDFCRVVGNQSIMDSRPLPPQISDTFTHMANGITSMEIKDAGDLMQVFQHYEVMVDSAGNIPHSLMSQTFGEADELINTGRLGAVDKLWRANRAEMIEMVNSVDTSLEVIRNRILTHKHLLKPDEEAALEALLERGSARDILRESTLQLDAKLLDDFWALPKAERTADEHVALRSQRRMLWAEYEKENAVLGAGSFITRKEYADLYYKLPKEKLFPVDASTRPLSPYDCARVMGCNVDSLSTGIVDTVSLHNRYYFIETIKQNANRNPTLFKGFTDEKIGRVYDDILRGMQFTPEDVAGGIRISDVPNAPAAVHMDIQTQKVLQQVESVRQNLITLKMTKALTPDEELALHAWVDGVAGGMDDTFKGISKDWKGVRQDALDFAQKEYYKSFADYTNETIVDYTMRMIFPYWTYHMYRWFFLPRTFIRKPGFAAAWGKYYDYSDYGWINVPGTDISLNPMVGSVMGATFTLGRYDFKSYYENLGWFGEALDFIQRRGFFPGAHFMIPLALTPIVSGRPPELGEVLPPLHKFGLESLVASNVPGVRDSAQWLMDKILHENFRDYYVETAINAMQVEAGGKLMEGKSGADLWHKRNRGEELTDEELAIWEQASNKVAWFSMLRSVLPGTRLREHEMLDAYKKVTQIFEEGFGMSEEYQKWLWRHNMRPSDVLGGSIPWEMQQTLDQIWEYKIWFGRGATLMPPDVSDLLSVINEFWNIIDTYQLDRVTTQATADEGFLHPTAAIHFDGKEWREENASTWTSYNDKFEGLKGLEKYNAVPWTPEESAELYKMQGYAVPTRGMDKEVLDIYFSIELEKKVDPYTGEEEWDYLGFWLKRQAVRMALPEELRADFDAYIRRYETPLERTFRLANQRYLRGYWATSRIILDDYTEEQKALIAEYYAGGTTRARKLEIREVVTETGRKLIAEWDARRSDAKSALREASPYLDFWLYVFGYISQPKTDEAKAMVDKWELDRDSILTML